MKSRSVRLRLFGMIVLIFVGGCAPAYHSYSGCRVNCKYCPLCPLPYCQYKECVCHSCAASKYMVTSSTRFEPEVLGEDSDEETENSRE